MKKICFNILIFLSLLNNAQNAWMIPSNIKETKVKTCIIHKVTPFQGQEKDSILQKFAEIKYNISGKEISLSAYRNDSTIDLLATHTYDSLNNEIEFTKRDFPDDSYYPRTPPKEDDFAKSMYDELHFHNRNTKEVSIYNLKHLLIEKDYYNESYNIELTEKHCYLKELYTYNEKGQLLEEKDLIRNEKNIFEIETLINYEYDKNENSIKEIKKDEEGKNTETLYEYDISGNKIKEIIKKENEEIRVNEFSYNLSHKLIEARYTIIANHPSYWYAYSYDTLNNKTKEISYESNGTISHSITYKYQDTLLIEQTYKNKRGDYNENNIKKYDANNRLIFERKWELNGSAYITSDHDPYQIKLRKFDKDSNIIEEKRYYKKKKKDDYAGKSEYFYNLTKQIIKERIIDEEDSLRRIQLNEYNSKGQITKINILNKDSALENIEINFYDSSGVRYARELYQPDKTLQLYQTYTYNDKGIENGGVFFQGGPQITLYEFYYNSKSLYNTVKVTDKNGFYFYYKYHYTYY